MDQQDFIQSNVKSTLIEEGSSAYIAENCGRQAAKDWAQCASCKGSMFKYLITKARASAKQMKKAES
jgi:hypothetical protein